jgi:hypothetical protein
MIIVAAVGEIGRYRSPEKPVSYLGLNPRVRQSAANPSRTAGYQARAGARSRGYRFLQGG